MNIDDLLAPQGDSFKYKNLEVGSHVQGVVIATPQVKPQRVYGGTEQAVSSSGNPMWQILVTIQTDEGNKTLWLEKSAYRAFLGAVRAEGIRTFSDVEGYAFRLTRTEDTPSKTKGFQPSKNFDIKLRKIS